MVKKEDKSYYINKNGRRCLKGKTGTCGSCNKRFPMEDLVEKFCSWCGIRQIFECPDCHDEKEYFCDKCKEELREMSR